MTDKYEIIVHQSYREFLTLEGLAASAGLHPGLVEQFVHAGLIEPTQSLGDEPLFDARAVLRLRAIERLRREVGISLTGIAIVLDLTDKIRELQREVEWLQSRLT
jgi:DNA-binding transcriptional MerR regulator